MCPPLPRRGYIRLDWQTTAGQGFLPKDFVMKNPMEVLRSKEQELVKVKKEIDALRTTVRLLNEEGSDFREGKVDLRQVIEMP
jgi:hypothetical protein